jgi:hypothetical protein
MKRLSAGDNKQKQMWVQILSETDQDIRYSISGMLSTQHENKSFRTQKKKLKRKPAKTGCINTLQTINTNSKYAVIAYLFGKTQRKCCI